MGPGADSAPVSSSSRSRAFSASGSEMFMVLMLPTLDPMATFGKATSSTTIASSACRGVQLARFDVPPTRSRLRVATRLRSCLARWCFVAIGRRWLPVMKTHIVLSRPSHTGAMGPTSFGASVPDLPGCIAVADSREEVEQLIQEAIALHVQGLREDGLPVPAPLTRVTVVDVA